MASLKERTFRGMIWSSIHRFGTMAITLVSNVVLARLLTPDDFGCIGMLMIFIALSNTFIDGGFGSALIQKKEPTDEDYSTIFYWNVFLSVVLYFALFLSSPLIARFYRMPILSSVLRVQGLVLIIKAFCIIQANQNRKQLQFKKIAIIHLISSVLSLSLSILAAYKGLGVWSLVIQQLALDFSNTILFWAANKWRPLRTFSLKSFKELFHFGGFMLLSNLFSTFSNEFQGLLVGRMFNPATMGLYSQAYRLEGSAATAISSILDQVTYPVLASLQDNRKSFIGALKRFIQIPAYVCSFVLMIMIVVAKPLIVLLFSEKWIDCVPYFQILCTAGLAVCLQGSANNAIAAIGKSLVLMKWTIVKRSLTIVFCAFGILVAGMKGLLWACVLGAWAVYFINAFLVERHIGYSFVNQIFDILPFILLSTVIGLFSHYIGGVLPFNMYLVAICQIVIASLLYILLSWAFRFDCFKYLIEIMIYKKSLN